MIIDLTSHPDHLAVLRRFYAGVYTREFPDADERESLENMERYLELRSQGWYGRNNYHILLLEEDGHIHGGIVADYFERSNIGMIEFMVVDPLQRGRGLGKLLLTEIAGRFHADSAHAGRAPLNGICGEVNDPYRRCDVDEHLDGFARMSMWAHFGFGLLDFPYVQPALGEGQDSVTGLGLMFRPEQESLRTAVPSQLVEEIVADYQIWAMRIPEPAARPEFITMQKNLRSRAQVTLLDMTAYICAEPEPPFAIREIHDGDREALEEFAVLYRTAFSHAETAVDVSEFNRGTRTVVDGPVPHHYWLWGLIPHSGAKLAGLASFFSFPHCGFGGYIALTDPLKGHGLLRRFLRQIERQIVSVNDKARGWYVECEPASSEMAVFIRCGFSEVPMIYRQPRLHTDSTGISEGKVLALLYKPFGRIYARPITTLLELQRDLREILQRIYYLDDSKLEKAMSQMDWPNCSGTILL